LSKEGLIEPGLELKISGLIIHVYVLLPTQLSSTAFVVARVWSQSEAINKKNCETGDHTLEYEASNE